MENYFNLEYLETFLIAAETGKLNQTAELTYRSHSAVSTQIKKLENQIGTPLFIRNKNTLTLTKGGEILRDYARQLLNINSLAFQALTGKTWGDTIAVAVPPDYAAPFMEKIYPKITAALPEYSVEVDFARSRVIRAKIMERKIDLGIVAMEPQYEDDIFLWEERLKWACAKDFHRNGDEPFPVALFSDDCIVNNHSLHCLKQADIPFKIKYTGISMDSVCACVKSGQAIALLMESLITEDMRVVPEEFLPCPFTLKMGCAWNTNTDNVLLHRILDCIQAEIRHLANP
ncbi:MAG: LysR family transcriptional regulator [Eubacterium sp.]|nr:LysR family transcriptional regulator [Eubacterium sp.]